ncbi:MAG: isoprenylcysteine carboxylmethyltransferase family protein [Acidobacteria bacterium]|nr:isoprenylcysteine carboxylmethyltransferase family protein [Acidobacteriota bacterium]
MLQRLRVPLGFVIAAAVLYFAAPTPVSILLGLPVALLGALFRALAAGVIKKDSELAIAGIYSLTRNPLYLGSSLLAAGFAIMSASKIAAGLLLIPSAVIYPNVIAREEEHLSRLFPEDFRLYQSKVPRFFPRLTLRLHPAFSFRQYVANGEYNTVLGFAAAVAVLVGKWYVST